MFNLPVCLGEGVSATGGGLFGIQCLFQSHFVFDSTVGVYYFHPGLAPVLLVQVISVEDTLASPLKFYLNWNDWCNFYSSSLE